MLLVSCWMLFIVSGDEHIEKIAMMDATLNGMESELILSMNKQIAIREEMLKIRKDLQALGLKNSNSVGNKSSPSFPWATKIPDSSNTRNNNNINLDNKNPGSPSKIDVKKICWLHIEKTSSWIGDFLHSSRCDNLYTQWSLLPAERKERKGTMYDLLLKNTYFVNITCNVEFCPKLGYGWHYPYNAKEGRWAYISTFRDPLKRIVSAYLFSSFLFSPTAFLPMGK